VDIILLLQVVALDGTVLSEDGRQEVMALGKWKQFLLHFACLSLYNFYDFKIFRKLVFFSNGKVMNRCEKEHF
jgi:hypothetical protein